MSRCEPHGNLLLDPSEPFPVGESDYCHACWRAAGGVGRAGKVVKTILRGKCLHLGVRTQFVPGCGGWRCEHQCLAGEPSATPGGNCQTCSKWEADS